MEWGGLVRLGTQTTQECLPVRPTAHRDRAEGSLHPPTVKQMCVRLKIYQSQFLVASSRAFLSEIAIYKTQLQLLGDEEGAERGGARWCPVLLRHQHAHPQLL